MSKNKTRKLQVVIRVRPLLRRELKENKRKIIRVVDSNKIIFDPSDDEKVETTLYLTDDKEYAESSSRKNLEMSFDQVFDYQATNQNVFEYAMRPLLSSLMQGYNCSAFVYGVTGAGKTYTMLGSVRNPGITYLTMKELFKQIKLNNEQTFDIDISYVEVYNEQVKDLLTKKGPLTLRDVTSGVVIDGLTPKRINNYNELVSLLSLGNRNRVLEPTNINYRSSRSHAILQVHIRMIKKANGENRMVKLSMIDLAGSERGSSSNLHQRVVEGANINKSLLALGNCIEKLADGSPHIPYRDSNMTRILKDSLGGNCETVIIGNVSSSLRTYNETYNTLRAQQIRTASLTETAPINNLPKDHYVQNLADKNSEIQELKERIKMLEQKVACQTKAIEAIENVKTHLVELGKTNDILKQKIDHVYSKLHSVNANPDTNVEIKFEKRYVKFSSPLHF